MTPDTDTEGHIFTAEEIENLTDEEIDAIMGDQKNEADEAAEAEPEADAAKDPEPASEPEPAAAKGPQFDGLFDVEKAQRDLQSAQGAHADLKKQYRDGDMTDEAYDAAEKDILKRMTAAEAEVTAARKVEDRISEAQRDQDKHIWFGKLNGFYESHERLNPKTYGDKDPIIIAWDAALKQVEGAEPHLSYDQQISLAYSNLVDKMQRAGTPLDGAAAPKKAEAKAVTPVPKAAEPKQQREFPPTLGGIPGSDSGATPGESPFGGVVDAIDQSPWKGEAAFSRLTPEEQERFLAEEV